MLWRNRVFAQVKNSDLQAVITFGEQAQEAVRLWSGRFDIPVVVVPHPGGHNHKKLLEEWQAAIIRLRAMVTPDPDGDPDLPNYGTTFQESDYARIPLRDLPWGVPPWLGDDSRGRAATPRRSNCVHRSPADLAHTLLWEAPTGGSHLTPI